MVRRQLWIANSTLIGLLILSMGVHLFIKQDVPSFRARKRRNNTSQQTTPAVVVNVEKIYKNDLFGTYVATPEKGPQAKNLVTPIPAFKAPASSSAPTPPKTDFLAPLNVTMKGIILSHDQSKSIVMLADQTGKENVYHVGDKVQDAQIIKLTKNKMVLLRSNGQLETFYLRKPDKLNPDLSSWDLAVKKIDDNLYHIDPLEITKGVSSVGEVIEMLDLGDAYEGKSSKGVQVGSITHHPLGAKLGLEKGDVITTINDISAVDSKQRIKIFDTIAALPMGSHIEVALLRGGKPKTISYLLKQLEKPSPFSNPILGDNANEEKQEDDELFKLSKNAQRQQSRRRFEHVHRTHEQHDQAITDMRQRLLTNMKERTHNRRVW